MCVRGGIKVTQKKVKSFGCKESQKGEIQLILVFAL